MYELENDAEASRLEKQALQENYSLPDELRFLKIKPGMKILDAGCGSGLLCKFLSEKYSDQNIHLTGFDFSETRVRQAEDNLKKSGYVNIKIEHQNLEMIKHEDNQFDLIICRFVIEHLENPIKAITELKRILRPNGVLYLIDLDGVWVNTYTQNIKFNQMMRKIENELNVDFIVGRKMAGMMSLAGLKSINWDVTHHTFKDDQLKLEYENNKERCEMLMPRLISILGSESEAKYFKDTFLTEMLKPETAIFHSKFIVRGTK
jgi:ubiquinone/menaquinone biosynthesis C-methylase UbiE